MSENKLSSSVLAELKEKNVQPKPKWHFFLHEWLLWGLGLISVLIGGLAMSIIFVQIRLIDWDLLPLLGKSEVIQVIPYLWVVLLVLFILLAQYQIKHTKRGYQYSLWAIVFLIVSLSTLLGSVFYQTQIGYRVHARLSGASDVYRTIADRKTRLWSDPESGRLGGVITDTLSDESFVLIDEEGNMWLVDHANSSLPLIPKTRGIPREFKVRVLGEMISENSFKASDIRPWVPPREAIKERLQNPRATKSIPMRTR